MKTQTQPKRITRLSSKRQISIHAAVTNELELETGTQFEVTTDGTQITLTPLHVISATDEDSIILSAKEMEEINAAIEEAQEQFARGEGIPAEEVNAYFEQKEKEWRAKQKNNL